MKVFILMALAFLSFGCSGGESGDQEAVKKVVRAFQDDFNEGSFKNAEAYSTSDWEHINPLGGIDKGRDSVLKTVRAVHQSFLKGVTMKIERMDIRFITADVAVADVVHQVDTYVTPDGTTHENERQFKTYIIVKQKGNWLLTHDQNTIIQSPGTAGNSK